MSSDGPIDLRCEIASIDGPIRGRVSDARGRSVAFHGWIEFAAALARLAEDAHRQPSDSTQEETFR